ncbi:LiaF domain-containing protein [Flexithrix dorotheae]|uniref:LiaF domain-containing protein n=1 Tax=Flexithrix dorotheae TaxID=70993 RepID=UPI00035C1E3C|nr:LiaF domain-containing protein [Flexithrix dorotheae]
MENNYKDNRKKEEKRPVVFGLPKLKDKVLAMLGNAFVENDLEITEYEKRLKIANEAKSIEELENAVYDFPQAHEIFPSKRPAAPQQPYVSNSPAKTFRDAFDEADYFTLIGDRNFTQLDITRPNMKVIIGIGDTMFDLREIAKKFTHIRIESYSLIGNLKIKVPENTQVKRNLVCLIGDIKQRKGGKNFIQQMFAGNHQPSPSPLSHQPPITLEIVGFKAIGDVVIEFYGEDY